MSGYFKPVASWRFYLLLGIMGLVASGLAGFVVWLNLFEHDFLKQQGDVRTLRVEPITAHRGMITDRHGEVLAISTPVVTLWINPQDFPKTADAVRQLAQAAGLSPVKLAQRLKRYVNHEFMYLRRQMTPDEAEAVLALDLPGVHARDEFKRYYPPGEVATHLVGFTNLDDQGQEGLELAYNDYLSGEPGQRRVLKDLKGRIVRQLAVLKPAQPGGDLTLSLDMRLQYLAYRELKAAVQQHHADAGSAVILDAKSGEVLAMVNQPAYNPNNRAHMDPESLRNRAMLDLLEPGSTVKPITVAAALMSGEYTPDTVVNTRPGYMRLGGHTVRDVVDHGVLTVTSVITKSSNIGVAKMAMALPEDAVWGLFSQLGMGRATGTGFPGESVGHLPPNTLVDRAVMAYGYGLSVTPLQLAQAYTPLADHGQLHAVSLLRQDKPQSHQVIPPKIAREVLEMMETVTQKGGSGTRARIPGYRVAGKTGTTHKVGSSGQYTSQYRAFFAGIAPVSDPRLIAVVVVDNPRGRQYYGGEVAAPVFSRLMGGALRMLNVPPDNLKTLPQKDLPTGTLPQDVKVAE